MTLYRVTAPANYPVNLDDLKNQTKQDLDYDDDRLVLALDAAVRMLDGADGWIGRALITQTWEMRVDSFWHILRLPLPPLQSVESIKYLDVDGVEQTLSSSVYQVFDKREPAEIRLAYQQSWPTTRGDPECVRVRFVCGYGDSSHDVPEPIRQRILMMAGEFFEPPEEVIVGESVIQSSKFVDAMLENFRVRV